MSERSVKCPACPFQFAYLVDAGDHHAYHCPACDWRSPTRDRRPANRPSDVCGLCDTAISPLAYPSDHHLYVGRGMVHGGGREYIPVHASCLQITTYPEGSPAHQGARARIVERLLPNGIDAGPIAEESTPA